MIDKLIKECLRKGIILLIDELDLILLLILFLLSLHTQLLLKIKLGPQFLRLLESPLQSSIEIFHAFNFSLPILIHGLVFISYLPH